MAALLPQKRSYSEQNEKLGHGPDKRLKLTVSTRNIPPYRDPAVMTTKQEGVREAIGPSIRH